MDQEHTTSQNAASGGPVGLTQVTQPQVAPNGLRPPQAAAPKAAKPPAPPPSVMNPAGMDVGSAQESNAGSHAQTKLSGMKKAVALSLLYKSGIGLQSKCASCGCKGGNCSCGRKCKCGKKVKVTASAGVPDKVKGQVSEALVETMPGYKSASKSTQLLCKLAAVASPQGLRSLVHDGDSVKVTAVKIAAVIKLRRAFKRIGLS